MAQTRRLDESQHIQALRDRVASMPENELYRFSLAKALFDCGNFTESISNLEVALKKKPDWMAACTLQGRAWLALGDKQQARACFFRAAELAASQDHVTAREDILKQMESLDS